MSKYLTVRLPFLALMLSGVVTAFALNLSAGPKSSKSGDKPTTSASCENVIVPLVEFAGAPQFEFKNLTTAGRDKIKELNEKVSSTVSAYNYMFEGQMGVILTHLRAMVHAQNVFITGDGGGAKTAGVNWLVPGIWTKQLHEMMLSKHIFGGQTEEGRLKGVEDINTEGSALNEKFVMLDEINNANPLLYAELMSYMNPAERRIYIAGKEYRAKTRTVFSTGNATRGEILEKFREQNMQSGPAFLNRYLYNVLVANWLGIEEQQRRDEVIKRLDHLRAIVNSAYVSEDARNQARQTLRTVMNPPELDFEAMELLAEMLFESTEEMEFAARDFAMALRSEFNKEVKRSLIEAQGNNDVIPFEATTDWTERLRTNAIKAIKVSALIDLLQLPSKQIEMLTKERIKLSRNAIWRLASISIMNSSWLSVFDPKTHKIIFNLRRSSDGKLVPVSLADMKETARNPRSAQQWADLEKEQTIFNTALETLLKDNAEADKALALLTNPSEAEDYENIDFEVLVYWHLWKDQL